eukprot:jgi/Botrbrau1/11203/Bobra.0214s0027.1
MTSLQLHGLGSRGCQGPSSSQLRRCSNRGHSGDIWSDKQVSGIPCELSDWEGVKNSHAPNGQLGSGLPSGSPVESMLPQFCKSRPLMLQQRTCVLSNPT